MALYTFSPVHRVVGNIPGYLNRRQLDYELEVLRRNFNGDSFIYTLGEPVKGRFGPSIARFLKAVPESFYKSPFSDESRIQLEIPKSIHVEVRATKMKVGELPTRDGWHFDGDKLYEEKRSAELILCNISTSPQGVSNTQFAGAEVTLDLPHVRPILSSETNRAFTEYLHTHPHTHLINTYDGQLVLFNKETFHTPLPAKDSGVRLFLRARTY